MTGESEDAVEQKASAGRVQKGKKSKQKLLKCVFIPLAFL